MWRYISKYLFIAVGILNIYGICAANVQRKFIPYNAKATTAYYLLDTLSISSVIENPHTNTIKLNYGDSILELVSPPVGDQGDLNSCAAWAFGYGCATIQAYNRFPDMQWSRRSPEFLFNRSNEDCLGSYTIYAANVLFNYGVCEYDLMCDSEFDCALTPSYQQLHDAYLNRSEPKRLLDPTDPAIYKTILKNGYPIGVVTKYVSDFTNMWDNNSGMWTSLSTPQDNAHTTCIVGYNDYTKMFKVLNSWGADGGDNGFYYVSYENVNNGAYNEAYVFLPIINGFTPRIEGDNIICDSLCFVLKGVPSNSVISWNITNNLQYDLSYCSIYAGQGTDSVCVKKQQTKAYNYGSLNTIMQDEPINTNIDSVLSILKVNVSNAGFSNYAYINIIRPHGGKPKIAYDSSDWIVKIPKTFSVPNCLGEPSNNICWTIKYNSRVVQTGTGISITYKPLVKGVYQVSVINNGRECYDNSDFIYMTVKKANIHLSLDEDMLFVDSNDQEYKNNISTIEI